MTSISLVWTSWKSSGLPESRLDFMEFCLMSYLLIYLFRSHLNVFGYASFSDLEDIWDNLPTTSRKSSRRLPFQSSGLPESRLDLLKVVWKSSRLPRSRLDFL
ncbi:hypothetical protein IGI04_018648, partial [Brassica rapa subsp. trilocularis]